MNTFIRGPLADTARNLMRRAGYGEHRGHGAQMSYVKRIHATPYPRYHAYVEDRDGGMQLNLHLDQKEASHAGSRAHGGEYDGPLVEREAERIAGFVKSLGTGTQGVEEERGEEPRKEKGRGFFDWLFN
jgi:hypothetical protein